ALVMNIGVAISDEMVVYDSVRENMTSRKESLKEIINSSINKYLRRALL
ncbi:MAG: protein translocase subunit SecF, partial [Planctomycetes bacterium]|nr:protein translocase subunit SecF [Planctomycetota bacterium]